MAKAAKKPEALSIHVELTQAGESAVFAFPFASV